MSEAKSWLFEIEVEKLHVNPRSLDTLGGQIDLHFNYSTPVSKRQENHSIFFPLTTLESLYLPDHSLKLLCAALRQNVMLRWCKNVQKIAWLMSVYLYGKFDFTPELLSGQGSLRPCIRINLEVEFHDQPQASTFVSPAELDEYDDLIILGQALRHLGECCGGDFGQVLMAVEEAEQDKDMATMKRVRTSGLPEDCGDCSICFERIDKYNVAIQTPCSHMFHETCIVRWFCTGNHSCPMCRSSCAVSI